MLQKNYMLYEYCQRPLRCPQRMDSLQAKDASALASLVAKQVLPMSLLVTLLPTISLERVLSCDRQKMT